MTTTTSSALFRSSNSSKGEGDLGARVAEGEGGWGRSYPLASRPCAAPGARGHGTPAFSSSEEEEERLGAGGLGRTVCA